MKIGLIRNRIESLKVSIFERCINQFNLFFMTNVLRKFNLQAVAALLFLSLALSVGAQSKLNLDKPEGTYILTDYQKRKITLKLGPAKSYAYCMTKGPGTITINGRTLQGTWQRFDDDPYIGFETYDHVRISYSLPVGVAKTDQIIISDDGRFSYNASELMKSDGDWVRGVKKVGGTSKKGTKKSKRK